MSEYMTESRQKEEFMQAYKRAYREGMSKGREDAVMLKFSEHYDILDCDKGIKVLIPKTISIPVENTVEKPPTHWLTALMKSNPTSPS